MDKEIKIDVKKVKYVMDKVQATYEEAERALIRNKGDKEKTVRWIESQRRTIFAKMGRAFVGMFFYKFIIKRRGRTFVNVPLWLVITISTILMIGMSNNTFYYFELEGAVILILFIMLFAVLLTGCDIIISKKEYEAKIRLKKVKRIKERLTNSDMEYEVKENEKGEYTIEVDE